MRKRWLAVGWVVALVALQGGAAWAWSGHGAPEADAQGSTFNLADLADGESRSFGEGEHRVTVTRRGDAVVLQGGAAAGEHRVECDLTRDRCTVTESADGGATLIWIGRQEACDSGDCLTARLDALVGGPHLSGGATRLLLHQGVDCAGSDECRTFTVLVDDAEGEPEPVVVSGTSPQLFRIEVPGKTLRCPEGDTTMRVEPEEAESVFLCPKHSLPLEPVESRHHTLRRIELQREPHRTPEQY